MTTDKQPLLIGIVGEKGSGKETCAKFLAQYIKDKKVVHITFSDILSETLALWSIERTRHNLQQLAIVMNEKFGLGTLTNAVSARIKATDADIIVLDGVRWLSDEKMIREFPKNMIVYVTAPPEVRYERTKARKVYVGEATASYETFLEEEKVRTELDIPKIAANADVTIDNGGTLEAFEQKVKEFCQTLSK